MALTCMDRHCYSERSVDPTHPHPSLIVSESNPLHCVGLNKEKKFPPKDVYMAGFPVHLSFVWSDRWESLPHSHTGVGLLGRALSR